MSEIEKCEARLNAAVGLCSELAESVVRFSRSMSEAAAVNSDSELAPRLPLTLDMSDTEWSGVVVSCANRLRTLEQALSRAIENKHEDSRQLLRLIAEAAQQISVQNSTCDQVFHEFSASVQALADVDDVLVIKDRMAEAVGSLKSRVDGMLRKSEVVLRSLEVQVTQIEKSLAAVEQESLSDPLTGLGNRRLAERRASTLLDSGKEVWLLLFDLNAFKAINDTFGHAVGDQTLVRFAKLLQQHFRPHDLLCRWGGDEFLVVIECDARTIRERISAIRASCGRHFIQLGVTIHTVDIVASIGVAESRPGDTLEALLVRADAELYADKNNPLAWGSDIGGSEPLPVYAVGSSRRG